MPRSIAELVSVPDPQRHGDWLLESLQAAIALEFSTIPVYLCAYWSIQTPDDSSEPPTAASLIQSIVIEEMLHLGLACNMLSSLGGTPDIVGAVPTYPRTGLPGGVLPDLKVTLAGLTLDRVTNVFMAIEYPEGGPVTALTQQTYPTIGSFYDAIYSTFTRLQPTVSGQKQLTFGSDPVWLPAVNTSNDFLTAIQTIKEQGEGSSRSPEAPDFNDELAHYYKFGSIANQAMYQLNNGAWTYTGTAIPFPSVYPVLEVPDGGYPKPPVEEETFNQTFTLLVDTLQSAWSTGDNNELATAINTIMNHLNTQGVDVVKVPVNGTTSTYCPTFEYQSRRTTA